MPLPRLASTFATLPVLVLAVAGLWPRGTPAPPSTVTLAITTEPPVTITVVDPPPVTLGRVSTELDVPAPDLDGDGAPEELVVQPDSCGTGGCVYDVYMSSPPRNHLGTLEGKWGYWSVKPRRGAFADITTTWFLGCCEVALTTYRFRRGAYREIARRSCDPREGHKPGCD